MYDLGILYVTSPVTILVRHLIRKCVDQVLRIGSPIRVLGQPLFQCLLISIFDVFPRLPDHGL